MGFFQNLTLNTIASFGGRFIGGLAALFSVGFITRGLGVSGFGDYATVVAYLSTFQILADLGLYHLLTKEISQKPEKEKELVGYFFTLRLLVAVFFLGLASVFVFLFPYSQEVKLGVVFTASAFLFLSLTQIFLGVFQKYLQVYKAAIAEIVGRLAQLALVWYFFQTDGGLFSYLGALLVGCFVIFLINLFFARRLVGFKISIHKEYWKRVLKKTYPIAIAIVFTLLYFKADTILLSVLRPAEDVGIYNAAYKVLETAIFVPAAFFGLMLPILSRYAKKSKEKLSGFMGGLVDITTIAVLPIVVGGVLVSSTIISFIGGEDFLAATLVMQMLFVAIGIIFYGNLFSNSIIALDLQKKAMWAYVLGFVFNFIANIIFIPQYTYIAAAATTVLTELLVTIYLVWVVRSEVSFSPSFLVTIKTVFATILMGGTVYYFAIPGPEPLSVIGFFGAVVLGVCVYGLAAWFLKTQKHIVLN